MFRHIDAESARSSQNRDYHLKLEGTTNVVGENELNKSSQPATPIADNEEMMISQKQ